MKRTTASNAAENGKQKSKARKFSSDDEKPFITNPAKRAKKADAKAKLDAEHQRVKLDRERVKEEKATSSRDAIRAKRIAEAHAAAKNRELLDAFGAKREEEAARAKNQLELLDAIRAKCIAEANATAKDNEKVMSAEVLMRSKSESTAKKKPPEPKIFLVASEQKFNESFLSMKSSSKDRRQWLKKIADGLSRKETAELEAKEIFVDDVFYEARIMFPDYIHPDLAELLLEIDFFYCIFKALKLGYSGSLYCAGKKVYEYQYLMPFGQVSVTYHLIKRALGELWKLQNL